MKQNEETSGTVMEYSELTTLCDGWFHSLNHRDKFCTFQVSLGTNGNFFQEKSENQFRGEKFEVEQIFYGSKKFQKLKREKEEHERKGPSWHKPQYNATEGRVVYIK